MLVKQSFKQLIPLRKIILAGMLIIASTSIAEAVVVNYTLDDIFTKGEQPLTGEFQWDYNEGDFENGTGTFSELFIPGYGSYISGLNITFDIGKSIEFSLAANLHNAGVDVTLFLVAPLTPTLGSSIDLSRSKWAVDGGFNAGDSSGLFESGSIIVSAVPVPTTVWLFGSGILGLIGVSRRKKNK